MSESMSNGEQLLPVRGARLCAETFGNAEDPAMLLIAGQDASMDWWDVELCGRLARHRYVIRYDHRDTGRSTTSPAGTPDYTSADLRDDAFGVLDALGVDTAHLVGVSMGGAIAQCLAVEHPARVSALTLIATSGGLPGMPEGLPGMAPELVAYFEAGPGSDDVGEQLLADVRALAGDGFDEHYVRGIIARVVERTIDPGALGNHALADAGPESEGALGDITAPTLVIHGDRDPLFPLPHGEALAQAIPGAQLLVLPGVGHDVPPPSTWDVVVPALLAARDVPGQPG